MRCLQATVPELAAALMQHKVRERQQWCSAYKLHTGLLSRWRLAAAEHARSERQQQGSGAHNQP